MSIKTNKTVSITGLGWFGTPLARRLSKDYSVRGTTRTADKLTTFSDLGIQAELLKDSSTPSSEVMNSDVLVLNIPPFKNQLAWFKAWKWNPSTHIIFISSTSVYGDQSGILDEGTLPVPNTEGGAILLEEENWLRTFPKTTLIRFGGLIGEERHPGKFLAGRTQLENGNWPVNLIHLEDCMAFTELVIKKELFGETYNLVHPDHPTRSDYYTDYCRRNSLPLPHFKTIESSGKTVSSQKAEAIYQFKAGLF